jgi:hypothetical protein
MKKFIFIALFVCFANLCKAQTYTNDYGEKCWVLWKFKNGEDTVMVVLVEENLKPADYLILKKLRSMSLAQIKSQATRWTNAGKRVEAFPYRKEDFENAETH